MLPLEFDSVAHVYSVGRRKLPGVTSVLRSTMPEFLGVPVDVLEAAARFGKHVHLACHLHNIGALDESALDPLLLPYLDGWRQFLSDTGAQVLESEQRVHCPELGVAGTLDAMIGWHDLPDVIDIKSGATVPKSVRPQTAAYRELRMRQAKRDGEQLTISRSRYCVHLTGDGRYAVHRYRDQNDWTIFLSALNIHRWSQT